MAQRLIQLTCNSDLRLDLESLLGEGEVVYRGQAPSDERRQLIQLLVNDDETESWTDHIESHLGKNQDYRVLVLEVEAALPRAEEEPDEPQEDSEHKRGDRVSREELFNTISDDVALNPPFMAMCVLSAVVATIGMARDDTAVVIGAMVIAPLLGPNLGLSLSMLLAERTLALRSVASLLVGAGLSAVTAYCLGLIVQVDLQVPAIAERTEAGLGGVALALAAGAAGALTQSRGYASAVIGVMVAVALLPPLVAACLLAGQQQWSDAIGAAQLLAINVVGVNIAAILTFLIQGIRPREWHKKRQAKQLTLWMSVFWLTALAGLVAWVVHQLLRAT